MNKPFLPADRARRPLGESFVHAAWAVAKTRGRYGDAAETGAALFPDDKGALSLLTRTDATPASLSVSGWAGSLAAVAVGEFISSLAPTSAAAKLIAAGMRLSLAGKQYAKIPRRKDAGAPATDIGWVAENEPIGVYQRQFDSVQLGPPKKLAAMVVCTNEVLSYSGGEQILGTMLREDVAATLDSALFDDTAAGATRPAGLLNGITPIDPSTATSARDQMVEDFANLGGAIADLGGNGENLIFICSPRQAIFARLNFISNEQITIWSTPALADGDIIAIQADAFVSAFAAEPTITLAKEATLVMSNPAGELVPATGGVSVIADPVSSLFQQDLVGIRILLPCSWCVRAPLIAAVSSSWAKAPA
jgi:Phage capsid family